MVQRLTYAFSFLKNEKKKSENTHIKEIQPFQRYFKTIYNPFDICQTIYDAVVTLKHELTTTKNFQTWKFLLM